jgi:PQQ-dependent dehydrogenase (methanol/ethanol family)
MIFLLAFLLSPQLFQHHCASCHGDDARGTAKGPGLVSNPHLAKQSTEQIRSFLTHGNPGAGMPSFSELPPNDLISLSQYLRSLAPLDSSVPAASSPKITWRAPEPGDWLTHNGDFSANRYSPLRQITTGNASNLKLQWLYPTPYFGLETTPLAASGVLYFTAPNQVIALDALTGSELWKYARPATPGMTGDAKLGTNRGVAILDDKVFFVTDNAHLLALNRSNGDLVWEVPMADEKQEYGGTIAPLIVGGNVIVGVAGADQGIRGFVAAFKAQDGALVWRRWTIPLHREPGAGTWQGSTPLVGGGSTWLTGSYDPAAGILYWPTGNPFPDSDDQDRPGDNLFTDCILALDVKTGEIKWHYQFTPHDVLDRDATEPPVLVDTTYKGKPRKLLLHADRNGFFYVLDRITGELLLAKTFLRRVDWAHEIDSNGRPVVIDPSGCPSDAANWSPTVFSPRTRLYYFMALEECVGKPVGYPDQTGQRFLRAVNIETGDIVWEVPQPGPARAKTWTGVLGTAGGVLFYGKPNGGFDAVDERTGKTLWHFPTNVRMKAPPITFLVKGKQYVAIAAGPNILCFAL